MAPVAFHRHESGALVIWLDDGVVVTCMDDDKSRELLEIGIGHVKLFNVKSFLLKFLVLCIRCN